VGNQPVNLSMTSDKLYLLTEAAEAASTTVETIRQRIKRGKIQAIKGNDGRVRVHLTEAEIEALRTGRPVDQPTGQSTSQPVENTSAINALEAHVQTLREQIERMRTDHAAEVQRLRDDRAAADARADAERDRLTADHAAAVSKLEQQLRAAVDRAGKADARVDDVLAEVRALREALAKPWWRKLLRR
jgi:chromosome segregation ATPase